MKIGLIMRLFYKSIRIGKGGRPFTLYKIRTLKERSDIHTFAEEDTYTWCGKFLRRIHFDELPQLWNWLRGDVALFGFRPEEERTWQLLPEETRALLSKHKPGLIDLASLYFWDEEKILGLSNDKHRDYWKRIRPLKLSLQFFYLENKCVLLKLAIIWIFLKKLVWSIIKK